jgi:hypothetical protein
MVYVKDGTNAAQATRITMLSFRPMWAVGYESLHQLNIPLNVFAANRAIEDRY